MKRRSLGIAVWIATVVLACGLHPCAAGGQRGSHHGDGGAASVRELLTWEHPSLELLLWDVTASSDDVRYRFALQLKEGRERARTWIGFPRYRTSSRAWRDAVFHGPHGRSRTLEVSSHTGGRSYFSVLVPHDTTFISVPVGDDTLELDLRQWAAEARTGRRQPAGDGDAQWYQPEEPPSYDDDPSAYDADEPVVGTDEELAPYEVRETFTSPPPGRPVRLEAELRWLGEKPFQDGALDAGESGELLVDVINDGQRTARDVVVRISPATIPHLSYPAEIALPPIDPMGVETVSLVFRAGDDLADAKVPLTVQVVEPFGHDASPIEFELTTRGIEPHLVLVDDFAVEGTTLPVPRDAIVTVRLRVRNVGHGPARQVTARVGTGEGVFRSHDSEEQFELGDLVPGQVSEIIFRCYANRRAAQMLLEVDLWDARSGPEPIRSQVILPLQDSNATPRIVRVTPDPREETPLAPPPSPLTSDVDRFVPSASSSRPDALAVVLGVGSYTTAPGATFAAEDARTAARYFQHALGIPASRVQLLLDDEVTLGQLHRIFGRDGWLARRIDEQTEVFVYFAGHGMAQLDSFVPYLIPADGDLNYVQQTGFPLDQLIDGLLALDAGQITIFIDACFSGLTREGGALLADARPLVLVPARKEISGVSLYTAARGTQLASALDDQGHGLFSYYLFKGLGGAADVDTDGKVTAGELGFFLEQTVPRAAAELDREQTPSVFLEDTERVLVEF